MEKIAFIGLGAMGRRMARRLIDAGHPVTVYNRSDAPAEDLVAAGATRAATPADAARGAEVVISMVTDDEVAGRIWSHPETGALAAMAEGAIAVESSTVTPDFVARLAPAFAERGVRFVDAPVAGSRPQAEAGQLAYLVGGESETVEALRPILLRMGRVVVHAGDVGKGALLKLAVNALFGIQVAALGELLGMLERGGIPRSDAMAMLGEMPITSPAAKGVGGLVVAGKFDPMFPVDLVAKDFSYVVGTAEALGGSAPSSAAALASYEKAREAGLGGENIHAVAKLFLD